MDLLAVDITLPRRSFDVRVALSLGTETVALVGPSGAGKTSLLRAIAGLERPAGRIALEDETWLDSGRGIDLRPELRRVGYLPQDYGLFPHLTVAGNVRFAGRVALARALAREPKVLLLDEPFGALDAMTRDHVRAELADTLASLELPSLLVTHAFEDAIALAGRVGVLDRGRMLQIARASELLSSPASATVAAITGANVLEGIAERSAAGSTVRLDGGGQIQSSTQALGRVEIAVHPWELELIDPRDSPLVDTVLSVRQDRGILVVRLTRFTVHVPLSMNGRPEIAQGSTVGLRAVPGAVCVLVTDTAIRGTGRVI